MSDADSPGQAPTIEPFAVGDWLVEPALNQISADSDVVHLEPRVMKLLVYLAAAEGRVVPRGELLDKVWNDAVVNEEALSRAVSELRKALRDDSRQPRYVQTIHKSGYRLREPVSRDVPSTLREQSATTGGEVPSSWTGWAWSLGLLALVVGSLWWWLGRTSESSGSPVAPLAAQFLTTYPGREIDPAIDSSGKRVVFAWNGGQEGGDYNLYVLRIGIGEEPLRITDKLGFEGHPTWSPDGSTVAFVRAADHGAELWIVPGGGGDERKLSDLEAWSFGLDWLVDGRSVVVSQPDEEGPHRLVGISLDSAEARQITTPDPRTTGDFKPAVSPDGSWIAFVRGSQFGLQDVYVAPTNGGQSRRISRSGGRIRGVDWSPDGKSVVYATDLAGGFGLWRAALDSPKPEWLPFSGQDIYNPEVASSGRLVFEAISVQTNLWEFDLAGRGAGQPPTRLPVHSTRQETVPALSPDGRRLAFVSNRGGDRSLWLSDVDGTGLRLLTPSGVPVAGGPVWSPEGERIAAGLVLGDYSRPFVIEVESGRRTLLVDEQSHALPVAWSRDGQRIYLTSDRGGQWEIWSIGAGGGALRRLTEAGGLTAAESESGDILYFRRPGDAAFYEMAIGSDRGPDTGAREVGRLGEGRSLHWQFAAGSIYGIDFASGGPRLARLDPATGAVEVIASPPGLGDSSFALSSDASRLIYGRFDENKSDLMFIDGAL